MVDVARIYCPFLARPPTPPKESSAKLSNDTAFLNGPQMSLSLLDTPDESPVSSTEYFKEPSGKARKKVGFSGWTQYHKAGALGSKSYDSNEQRRRVPPSRGCNPTKSILKPYVEISSVESKDSVQVDQTSLPDMLRSAALHLTSDSRSSKIDAYTSLLGCLIAYDDVPDPQDLAEKVEEIAGAIRKDIDAKNGDGTPDAQLAAQALKLVTVLLCMKGTINLVPEELCSTFFEQSIACMEDPRSPKILVSHHMHLVEKQKFSPKVLTTEKLNRLLSVLSTITTRVKGNRVVCHRLNIYQRLILQARALMISRVGSWMDNLVAGMLSTIKDVRARAIAFGIEAGLQLGTVSSVSQECINVFNRQSTEGRKVVVVLEARLTEMARTKEDGLHVPQIWSVVLLFFRSRPQQIERWEHLKPWLGILQQCFNSSDAQIKFQANIAWNRFIFALDINTSTSTSMARMLKQPIVSQLERKSTEKNAKLAKQIARSSYCTLLYYALCPSATHAQLDQYWDLYVVELLPKAFAANHADVDFACTILASLFNSTQHRIWDANKANSNNPTKPEDLPNLDPKWIRSKTESILRIFEKLFELAEWRDLESSPVLLAWRSFMSALGNASSKEVKVSVGTLTAIAKIVERLKQFLLQRCPNTASSNNIKKFNELLKEAVIKLGHIPFNEKRLLLTQSNAYEAAAETPSSRGSLKSASLDSAAGHLISLLMSVEDGYEPDSRQIAFQTLVGLTLQNASSRRTRLKILRNVARHVLLDRNSSQTQGSLMLWDSLAREMISALALPRATEKHDDSQEDPGHEYRDVVKVLELGVHLHSQAIDGAWRELFDCLCETLGKEMGKVGVVLVVQEPLAQVICSELVKCCDENIIHSAVCFLKNIQWPVDSKVVEHVQMQLWGVMPVRHKSDPLEVLKPSQRLAKTLLEESYAFRESLCDALLSSALSAVTVLVNSLPREHRLQFVNEIQQGFTPWIEDARMSLVGRSEISFKIHQMFETIMASLESAPEFDNKLLAEFEGLLTSCFRSKRKRIINRSIHMWNLTFATAITLDYSTELQKALLKLKDATDIELPDFPYIGDSENASSPIHLIDSQESEEEVPRMQGLTPNKQLLQEHRSPRFSTPLRKFGTVSPKPASSSKDTHNPPSVWQNTRTTPKARLRHDNSQIQFAAIESSPMADDGIEPRMLTDRQQEVKERQDNEASLFPEIRSSPKGAPIVAEYRLPTLILKSNEAPDKLRVNETTSPSFLPDTMMSDLLGSSPTPSSSRNRSKERYSDEDPPSSPPMISSHLQTHQMMVLPQQIIEVNRNKEPLEDENCIDEVMDEVVPILPPTRLAVEKSGKTLDEPTGNEYTLNPRPSEVDTNIHSDVDIYVDAPSEPSRELSPHPRQDADVVMSSVERQGSSHAVTENDLVNAQLMGEIAYASQRSNPQSLDVPEVGEATKKRKFRSADASRKRTKKSSLGDQTSEVALGEVVADCVLIEGRTCADKSNRAEFTVEGKRSALPQPMDSVIPAPDNTPDSEGGPRGLARGLGGSDKVVEVPATLRRIVRVKKEQGAERRSGRHEKTSSRLSDVGASSRICCEASLASQEVTGNQLLPWTQGPSGSGWAYILATAPTEAVTAVAQPTSLATNDDDDYSALEVQGIVRESSDGPNTSPVLEASEILTPDGIASEIRRLGESIKKVSLRPEEERALLSSLLELMQEGIEAGRRHPPT